ncbi:uncharacterized protein LOC115210659 isoform X2 [Argonauta hians]
MASELSCQDQVRNILSSFISSGVENGAKTISTSITNNHEDDSDDDGCVDSASKDLSPNDPRNKVKYLSRVGSYSVRTWFAKPLSLSPMICARYGWENTDVDMLHCVCCKAVLCAKLPNSSKHESYKEFCDKLRASLVTAHEALCPWSSNPSPEFYAVVNCHNKDKVIRGFSNRINKLTKLTEEKLPAINLDRCEEEGISKEFWDKLCVTFGSKLPCEVKPLLAKLLPLAACGWLTSDIEDVLVCKYCQHNIALWNYVRAACSPNLNGHLLSKSPETPQTRKRKKSNNAATEKRIKLSTKESLDPVSEHRNWCPWINVESCQTSKVLEMELTLLNDAVEKCSSGATTVQADQDTATKKKKFAWVEICNVLAEYIGFSSSSTTPAPVSPFCQLRHVRNLLSMWSSPQQPPPKSNFIEELTKTPEKTPEPKKSPHLASKPREPGTAQKPSAVSPQKSPEAVVSPQMTRTAQLLNPVIEKEFTVSDITKVDLDEILSAAMKVSKSDANDTAKTAKESPATANNSNVASVKLKPAAESVPPSVTTIPKTPNINSKNNPAPQTVKSGPNVANNSNRSNVPVVGSNTRSASTPQHIPSHIAQHRPNTPHLGANTRSANINMNTRSNNGPPLRFPNTHPPAQRGMMTRMAQKAHQQNFQRQQQQKWRWAN